MSNGNYIKVNRSIINWEWYDDINTFKLFMHLILTVNWKDTQWRGKTIKRGQRVSSYAKLAEETHLTIKQIRGSLEKLKQTGEVAHQNCFKYGLFTVINYDKYQSDGSQCDSQTASDKAVKGQDKGKQRATIEEYKEGEESKEEKNNIDIVETPTEISTAIKFESDSFEMLCVETIIHSCLEIYPNSKVPSTQKEKEKWAIEIDRMKRLDNRTEEEIRQALQFAITDSFWKSNIRSAKKFREKFETLMIQSNNPRHTQRPNKEQENMNSFKDIIRELYG